MLAPVGLAQLDAGDLGDRIGFVGPLQRPGQQGFLGNRLGSLARINAGRAEEQKFFDIRLIRRADDVRFNEQIVVKEIRGEGVIRAQAADAAGG